MIRLPFADACAFYLVPNKLQRTLYPIRYMLEIHELRFHHDSLLAPNESAYMRPEYLCK